MDVQLRFLLSFLSLIHSSVQFCNKWESVTCPRSYIPPRTDCFRQKDGDAFLKINSIDLVLICNSTVPDRQVWQCHNWKKVEKLTTRNCYFTSFLLEEFLSEIIFHKLDIIFDKEQLNYDKLTFESLPFLRKANLTGLRSTSIFQLNFGDLPSLDTLHISNYNFTSFSSGPFRNLKNLFTLNITNGMLENLQFDLFYQLHKLRTLILSHNRIKNIPEMIFKNLSLLILLDISGNRIEHLANDIFSSLSNLKFLGIRNNNLAVLPENLLVSLPRLFIFDMSLNEKITFIPKGFLRGLRDLQEFYALNCSLLYLEESLFLDTQTLGKLVLSYNDIRYIPDGIFNNTKKLKFLYLGINKLSHLPSQVFFHLSKLEKLYLSYNELQILPKDIFRHLGSLTELHLSNNQLISLHPDTFRSLNSLKHLDISNNKLSSLFGRNPFNRSKYLSGVKADNSRLKTLHFINWRQHNLALIDLRSNFLTEVTLPIFTKSATKIILSNNNISTIYIDYQKYGNNSLTYDLNGKNIACDCKLQQFLHFVQSDRRMAIRVFPQVESFQCSGEKKTKLLNILPIYTICSVNEDCPSSCQCFLTAERRAVIDCSGQNLHHLPTILPVNATFIYLNNNNITHLSEADVSRWNDITHLWLDNNSLSSLDNWTIPRNLNLLALQGNQLSDLPLHLMNHVASSDSFKIYLANNQWKCDCQSISFKNWFMQNLDKIIDSEIVSCERTISTNSFVQQSLIHSTPVDLFCPKIYILAKWKIVVIIISVIILLILLILTTIGHRYNTTIRALLYSHNLYFSCRKVSLDENKCYDAFICYNNADREIMMEIMNRLEPPYRLCIHERDWLIGYPISQYIVYSVQHSRKTVILLSSSFLQSIWLQVEFQVAFNQMMEDQVNRLVLVIVGELGNVDQLDKVLRHLIATRTYLKWGEKWFWDKLKYSLSVK